MAVELTGLNNSTEVSDGLFAPRFTMNVKGLNTRNKTLNLEPAQFELHFENIDRTSNKMYVTADDAEERLDILTGTYTTIEYFVSVINETLKKPDIRTSRLPTIAAPVESVFWFRKARHAR